MNTHFQWINPLFPFQNFNTTDYMSKQWMMKCEYLIKATELTFWMAFDFVQITVGLLMNWEKKAQNRNNAKSLKWLRKGKKEKSNGSWQNNLGNWDARIRKINKCNWIQWSGTKIKLNMNEILWEFLWNI